MTTYPNAYPNWIYSMCAFIGFLASAIPLPWHLEAWNTGTVMYMVWTGLLCLHYFINSVVWYDHARNLAPIWCDISVRFQVGAWVAVPACSLCINRRLYHIATANTVTITRSEKRRNVMVDLAICIGIPVLQMILQYIPQGHRFNIYEEIGCYPFTYLTPIAYPLVYCWPLAISLVSAVYCFLSIRAFHKRRSQFKELLSSNNNLSSNRYFRLMSLAGVELLFGIPMSCYLIYIVTLGGVQPWLGWENTHYGFSRVDQVPAAIWRRIPQFVLTNEFTRWSPFACSMLFFAFFGFADEARKHYRSYFNSVAQRFGYTTATMTGTGTTSSFGGRWKLPMSSTGRGTLPVMVSKTTSQKRDSMDSFSSKNFSKEKSLGIDISYGALSLSDVGGTLADYKESPPSPSPSSGSSSSASSIMSDPPTYPDGVNADEDIEISSMRRGSVVDSLAAPRRPEPALNSSSPRHPMDTPHDTV